MCIALYTRCFLSVCEKNFKGDSGGIRTHDLLLTCADVLTSRPKKLILQHQYKGLFNQSVEVVGRMQTWTRCWRVSVFKSMLITMVVTHNTIRFYILQKTECADNYRIIDSLDALSSTTLVTNTKPTEWCLAKDFNRQWDVLHGKTRDSSQTEEVSPVPAKYLMMRLRIFWLEKSFGWHNLRPTRINVHVTPAGSFLGQDEAIGEVNQWKQTRTRDQIGLIFPPWVTLKQWNKMFLNTVGLLTEKVWSRRMENGH